MANARLTQKLEATQRNLVEYQKSTNIMKKEMMETDNETMEMYLAIEKLQQELQEMTTMMQQRDETIASKNAYLHVLQAKLQSATESHSTISPGNVRQLMDTLDSAKSSDV